jgi:hypothetical protein
MSDKMADPGQDLRGAPDIDPLWTILDLDTRRPQRYLVPRARIQASPLTMIK